MSEKNINTTLVRRVNKLLESRVEHDKVFVLYFGVMFTTCINKI